MTRESTPNQAEARARFRRTLVRVLVMQAVALVLLAALQLRYDV